MVQQSGTLWSRTIGRSCREGSKSAIVKFSVAGFLLLGLAAVALVGLRPSLYTSLIYYNDWSANPRPDCSALRKQVSDALLEAKRESLDPTARYVVHVAYEVEEVASFGGLGAAVRTFLLGGVPNGLVVMPHYGFLQDTKDLFVYDTECGLAGFPGKGSQSTSASWFSFSAPPPSRNSEFRFSTMFGPGGALIVLVRPPRHLDPFVGLTDDNDIYKMPTALASRVFAHGAAIALAALCGVDAPFECQGAVFHGSHTARALIATRQLAETAALESGAVGLALDREFRALYMMHDALSEVLMMADEYDAREGLGGADLSLIVNEDWEKYWKSEIAGTPAPGFEILSDIFRGPQRAYIRLMGLAALHADAIAIVSPSLAEALLPPGIGISPAQVTRVLHEVDRVCRLWAILPVAQDPAPALLFPNLLLPPAVADGALPQTTVDELVDAKKRARVQLLGDEFAGPIESRRPIVLFVGRFGANKGAALIPDVAASVCENGGHMLVVSTGPVDDSSEVHWQRLQEESKKVCGDHLTIIPGRDAVDGPLARAAADVCLIPSWLEGYCLVAAEAIRHGCYIVVSDTTGLRDIAVMAGATSEHGSPSTDDYGDIPFPRREQARPTPSSGLISSTCPDRSAVTFNFPTRSRVSSLRDDAMASPTTVRNANAAVNAAIADLRACGPVASAAVAIRSANLLSTPTISAGRLVQALEGKHSCGVAPVRTQPANYLAIARNVMDYRLIATHRDLVDFHRPLGDQGSLWTQDGVCDSIQGYGIGAFELRDRSVHVSIAGNLDKSGGISTLVCFQASPPPFVVVSSMVDVCGMEPGGTATLSLDAWHQASPYANMISESITKSRPDPKELETCRREISVVMDVSVPITRIVLTLSTQGRGNVIFGDTELAY